jgi:hypothetical protein
MTDQFYGEESIKIKQTAKTGWVQSEFRKQEKYRRNATASEIMELIQEVQKRVYEQSGVRLEPEVKLLGF